MKRFADGKRTERKFKEGDWVYLKLQPYRQLIVQRRSNQKLSPKFYGPFEVISRVGKVAYELRLPPGSLIHPVFHVSQRKAKVGEEHVVTPNIPLSYPQSQLEEQPEGILGRRVIKKNNEAVPRILVKWKNQEEDDASWEDYEAIKSKFPQFILRDKDNFEREAMSGKQQLRLGAVEQVDQVKCQIAGEGRDGPGGQMKRIEVVTLISGTQEMGSNVMDGGQPRIERMTVGPTNGDVK